MSLLTPVELLQRVTNEARNQDEKNDEQCIE